MGESNCVSVLLQSSLSSVDQDAPPAEEKKEKERGKEEQEAAPLKKGPVTISVRVLLY